MVATDLLIRLLHTVRDLSSATVIAVVWATFFFALGIFTRSVLDIVRYHKGEIVRTKAHEGLPK